MIIHFVWFAARFLLFAALYCIVSITTLFPNDEGWPSIQSIKHTHHSTVESNSLNLLGCAGQHPCM